MNITIISALFLISTTSFSFTGSGSGTCKISCETSHQDWSQSAQGTGDTCEEAKRECEESLFLESKFVEGVFFYGCDCSSPESTSQEQSLSPSSIKENSLFNLPQD